MMKKIIEEILESEQVLNLRDKSNRRYITGMIMEAIRSEGWYLNIGTHRATTRPLSGAEQIAEFQPKGLDLPDIGEEVRYDGDGKRLSGPGERRVKSYGFFKNEYYDD